jgi:hypothetical protein
MPTSPAPRDEELALQPPSNFAKIRHRRASPRDLEDHTGYFDQFFEAANLDLCDCSPALVQLPSIWDP